MKWLPITEKPASTHPQSALVIGRDHDDGEFYIVGIGIWRNGELVGEDSGVPLAAGCDYWYVLEDDLLLTLPEARLHIESQAELARLRA